MSRFSFSVWAAAASCNLYFARLLGDRGAFSQFSQSCTHANALARTLILHMGVLVTRLSFSCRRALKVTEFALARVVRAPITSTVRALRVPKGHTT